MSHVSVVIPTYNNERDIGEVLRTLVAQQTPPAWTFELLLADDGSTDRTVKIVRDYALPPAWQLQMLAGAHQGAAAARNRALSVARGEVVVLLGADIILRPGAIAAHIDFHQRYPEVHHAALGHIQWDPRVHPTPLMEWMNHGGPQNSYDDLLDQTWVDPTKYFYGSHISLKRSFLPRDPFATTFGGYGWEDLELGRRLAAQGLVLQVLWAARGFHRHVYSAQDLCRRQVRAGQSLGHYHALHPQAGLLPRHQPRQAIKHALGYYAGIAWLLARYVGWRHGVSFPHLYAFLARFYMWRGILLARHAST